MIYINKNYNTHLIKFMECTLTIKLIEKKLLYVPI